MAALAAGPSPCSGVNVRRARGCVTNKLNDWSSFWAKRPEKLARVPPDVQRPSPEQVGLDYGIDNISSCAILAPKRAADKVRQLTPAGTDWNQHCRTPGVRRQMGRRWRPAAITLVAVAGGLMAPNARLEQRDDERPPSR